MSIYIRPVVQDDVEKISSGIVKSTASTDMKTQVKDTIVDPVLFGKTDIHRRDKNKEYEDIYTRTATINLTLPVLNPFLAGQDGFVWKVLLNNKDVEDIMKGKKAYNKSTDSFYNRDDIEVPYSNDWLIGGELLLYLIEKVDIEERIQEQLYADFVLKFLDEDFKKEWKKERIMYGRVYKDSSKDINDDGYLCDEYFYEDPSGKKDIYDLLRKYSKRTGLEVFHRKTSALAYLLSYKNNPAQVKDQVMKKLFVLPYGYRPTIDNRVDPLTVQYNQLVKTNNELLECMKYSGFSLSAIMKKYEYLVEYIIHIFMGSSNLEKYSSNNYKSIIKQLSGKKGHMRDDMQGVRIDYSGRSVITCDPKMPLDTIGVPKAILNKLLELDIVREKKSYKKNKDENMSFLMSESYIREMQKVGAELLEGEYVITGRQPTLFLLGIQAFKVVIVEGNSLILNPLIVMPFNADFDGDQMHIEYPVTPEAKAEVRELMASTNNLFYPRNGELSVIPRHEILYGLWICSTVINNDKARDWSISDLQELGNKMNIKDLTNIGSIIFHGICNQSIAVYDKIKASTLFGVTMHSESAGIWALKYSLGSININYALGVVPLKEYSETVKDTPVSTKWFKKLFALNCIDRKADFINIINNIVMLGFAVSEIWPPSITTINDINLDNLINEFNQKISDREELLNRGIEVESAFTSYFDNEYKILQKKILKEITEQLGEDNGYIRMWKSGAKGNESNILQLFGTKGRIMKDDVRAFNTIIKNSLSEQLTGLEHFITAYGSRQGLVDKVLSTSKPGYLTRKLGHATAQYKIVSKDCGTRNGIRWTYDDILPFIDEVQLSGNNMFDITYVKEYLCNILVGRVILPDNRYVESKDEAEKLFAIYVADVVDGEFIKKNGILVRSPITCDSPICQCCYGKDISTNLHFPKLGKPVGFVAAQAVGEPGTQLTMKNFQRGGVASDANLTSSFKKIDKYLHLTSMTNSKSNVLLHDALSPVRGYVKTIYMGDGTKKIQVTKSLASEKNLLSQKQLLVHEAVNLKDFVEVGDSFQKVQGDLDINEILKYRSTEDAYKYLTLMLYNIFNEETEISCKHFEVVVASMLSFVIIKGNSIHKTGEILSLIEYKDTKEFEELLGYWTILGIGELPKYRKDFFEAMILENMKTFVPRASILNPVDSMKNPKTRLSFGLPINMGSDIEGYCSSNILRK